MTIGLIPAAGLGTRTRCREPKELQSISGKLLIDYSIDNLLEAGIDRICVVTRVGKEAIQNHLERQYPDLNILYSMQDPPHVNLIDAFKAAYPHIANSIVHLALPDTILSPVPYPMYHNQPLLLHCYKQVADEWRHFGCVDRKSKHVIEKPGVPFGDACWGALSCNPTFTEALMRENDLTEAFNTFGFESTFSIQRYADYGLQPFSPEPTSSPTLTEVR